MLERYLELRCRENHTTMGAIRAKLSLRGLHPDDWNDHSPDDEEVIEQIKDMAARHNIDWKELCQGIEPEKKEQEKKD